MGVMVRVTAELPNLQIDGIEGIQLFVTPSFFVGIYAGVSLCFGWPLFCSIHLCIGCLSFIFCWDAAVISSLFKPKLVFSNRFPRILVWNTHWKHLEPCFGIGFIRRMRVFDSVEKRWLSNWSWWGTSFAAATSPDALWRLQHQSLGTCTLSKHCGTQLRCM